tara:strand:- start:2084 stop:2401 length:318 start_codon:yes stop_codon:yes gene_type:complete
MFVISLLLIAGLVGFFTYRQRQYKALMEKVGPSARLLSERSVSALGAYEHYFDCNQPEDIASELLQQGFIGKNGDRFSITQSGKAAGEYLNVFKDPSMVFPIRSV